MDHDRSWCRRRVLRYLAASPLLGLGVLASWNDLVRAADAPADATTGTPIASPNDALNVFDLEPVARHKLSRAHFAYMATGVDDDRTLRANREGLADAIAAGTVTRGTR